MPHLEYSSMGIHQLEADILLIRELLDMPHWAKGSLGAMLQERLGALLKEWDRRAQLINKP